MSPRGRDASLVVLHSEGRNGLTVVVSVSSGARVKQITDATGRDWLADNGRANPPYNEFVGFASGTRAGWDECLPSIAECQDPNPNRAGSTVPDHGAFWILPWHIFRLDEFSVGLDSSPIDHPLEVKKTLMLVASASTLETRIRVTNRGQDDYAFLYSAHPLWNWQEVAIIEVPGATGSRAGFGSLPRDLDSTSVNLDPSGARENYKYFLRWAGHARLRFPSVGAQLTLRQDSGPTPWLGVCVNRGAWPSPSDNERWIALEPTNSPSDSLLDAIADSSATTLAPGEYVEWVSTVSISYNSH